MQYTKLLNLLVLPPMKMFSNLTLMEHFSLVSFNEQMQLDFMNQFIKENLNLVDLQLKIEKILAQVTIKPLHEQCIIRQFKQGSVLVKLLLLKLWVVRNELHILNQLQQLLVLENIWLLLHSVNIFQNKQQVNYKIFNNQQHKRSKTVN